MQRCMYMWWFLLPLFVINTKSTCKALQGFALLQLFPKGFSTSRLGTRQIWKPHHTNMGGGCCAFELHISVSLAEAEQVLCSAEFSPTAQSSPQAQIPARVKPNCLLNGELLQESNKMLIPSLMYRLNLWSIALQRALFVSLIITEQG